MKITQSKSGNGAAPAGPARALPLAAPPPGRSRLVPGNGGDVLLLSMRRLEDLVAYAMTYEFEDVIGQVAGADRVDVDGNELLEFSRRAYKLLRLTSGSAQLARAVAPRPATVQLRRDYELFFPTFNHAYELYALAAVPGWRKRCRMAACFISELWVHELPTYLIELLAEFDHIFLGLRGPMADVSRITGRPCSFLPMAADVLRFSPVPNAPARVIDVCNIGRRSAVTHDALVALARRRKLFYYYDTVAASGIDRKQRTFHVQDAAEHRLLLANLLRRCRFYFANRSRANQPEFTRGHEELSGRFYEGSAAGAVMLGDAPDTDDFRRLFDWPDAVVRVPFDCPDIGRVLAELNGDPRRVARIGRMNAHHAALRHDWVHRLRQVYSTLGLKPTAAMLDREDALAAMAALALEGPVSRRRRSVAETPAADTQVRH